MKTKNYIYRSALFCGILLLFACGKDDATVNRDPEKVVLLRPANNLTNVAIKGVNLEWQAATDPDGDPVIYDLYLDTEPKPQEKLIGDFKTALYSLQTDLAFNTTYYWRVTAKDGKGGTSDSDVYSFTTREKTMQELIVGTWTVREVVKDGLPILDDCERKSYYQFHADGSLRVVAFSGTPCAGGDPTHGTYSVSDQGRLMLISGDQVVTTQITHLTTTSLKFQLDNYIYLFGREE